MCVFCERRPADSPEHLTPEWLRQSLPPRPKTATRKRAKQGGVVREVYGQITPFDASERCVCTPCNTHWMSNIDNAVKPGLLPLVLGQSRSLDADAQLRLATWAFKTCLVFQQGSHEVADPYPVIPREHYRYLYRVRKHPRPPERTQIWFAGYVDQQHSFGDFSSLEMLHDGSLAPGAKAYGATLVVGKLVVQIFATYGYDENLPPLNVIDWAIWDQVLVRIWPINPISWPGARVLDVTALRGFVSAWSNGALNMLAFPDKT
jgi:hypothetical protein